MRRLARAFLTLVLIGSLAMTLWAGARLAASPQMAPLRERSAQEIVAATDRMMAREATPDRLAGLITARLAEDPRNWVALEALQGVVEERGLVLPAPVQAAYAAAEAEDDSFAAQAADCAVCFWDIAQCSLSMAMICKAPLMLTPLEDLRGLSKAGWDYLNGTPVDRLDLALSIVGLGATALLLATAGGSEVVKLGASVAKLARGLKVLSPGLERMALTAVETGVDWAALARLDHGLDLGKAVRVERFEPLAQVAGDLGRMQGAAGLGATLHLMRYVDDAAGARKMARATEALGAKAVGRAEVLGPSRLMRATLRASEVALQAIAGLVGLLWSAGAMLAGAVQGAGVRLLRRLAR